MSRTRSAEAAASGLPSSGVAVSGGMRRRLTLRRVPRGCARLFPGVAGRYRRRMPTATTPPAGVREPRVRRRRARAASRATAPTKLPGLLGRLQTWLVFGGVEPSAASLWCVAYAALFLIRPWELLVPQLEPLRLETVGLGLLLVRIAVGRDTRFDLTAAWPTFALVGAMGLAGLLSVDRAISYHHVEQVVRIAIFALCLGAALRTPADLRAFLIGVVAIVMAYHGKALWEFVVHGRAERRMGMYRLTGIEHSHGDPNSLASMAVFVLPWFVLLYQEFEARWLRWTVLGGVALALIVVMLSGSRMGLASALFVGAGYVLASRYRARAIVAAAVVAVIGLLVMPDDVRDRYLTIVDLEANESATLSAEGRLVGLRKGIDLFRRFPLAGVGPGVFPDSSHYVGRLSYEFVGLRSHNLVGQLLGEHGLIGVAGFGAFLIGTMSMALRLRRLDPRASPQAAFLARVGGLVFFGLAIMLFQGITGHNLRNFRWLWLAALAAAAIGCARRLPVEARTTSRFVRERAARRRARRRSPHEAGGPRNAEGPAGG